MSPTGNEFGGALRRLFAPLLLVSVGALSGCGKAPASAPAAPVSTAVAASAPAAAPGADALELGRKIYNYRCYFCHGYSGDARTLATTYLEPKPRDFSNTPPQALPRELMLAVTTHGKAGTAMKGFQGILAPSEIEAVTDFVRSEFMEQRAVNTRYHTTQNGWPNHERHQVAFPFARGELAIDTPWEQLDGEQQRGKRLFLTACITCHDHGRVQNPGTPWESRPVSFPRDAYCTSCHTDTPRSEPQGVVHPRPATHTFAQANGSVPVRLPQESGPRVGSAYLVHDKPPAIANPTPLEKKGERLFQKNCAFCHAGDGTSKGWIGSFLEPHPRDLTSREEMRGMTRERMHKSIAEGLPGTSMPAWKEVLADGDIDALIAYISRAFHPIPGVRGS